MTDLPDAFELAAAELRKLRLTLRRLPGEYAVNFAGGADATARIVETLDQALEAGRSMAADIGTRPGSPRGPRRRRPLRMTPKAVRRRMIRAHNRRLRARALRQQAARNPPHGE